ncbi:hypothetical protein I5M27_03405 [Adhaeribacter sp. BT258]|uniref:Uncharacterized protein n=1 Tax=Adhaeribacter terrigena TaxID=2793070 RepID=A0ABS1BXZ3_9BACT|nr:hypothetical protein [Adhaeribacter terrigena]MBK0402016.1 hypothetical protein [Adhaeribacter terrigena]
MQKWSVVWLLLLVVLCGGCFNVREPEKPDAISEWTPPTQPDILTDNFSKAVRTLNISVYSRCFTPGFRFKADPATAGANTALFENWTAAEERDYFNSLKNKSAGNALNLLDLTKTRENFFRADSLEQFFSYKLRTSHTDTTLKPHDFTGTMRLVLTRKNNEWLIAKWEDNRENQACWSDLKKHFIAR